MSLAAGSIFLIGLILYWGFVPPKSKRKQMIADLNLQEKQTARQYKRITYPVMMVDAASYDRDDMVGYLTCFKPTVIMFDQIMRGDYQQTVYCVLDFNGGLTTYPTNALAQAAYKRGDYGMVSICMTDGRVQFQDILPEGEDPKNLIRVRLDFKLASK